MDEIEIRPIAELDFGAIAPLLAELGYPVDANPIAKRLAMIRSRPDFATFVAASDARIIGFVGACIEPSYTHDQPNGRIVALAVSMPSENGGSAAD